MPYPVYLLMPSPPLASSQPRTQFNFRHPQASQPRHEIWLEFYRSLLDDKMGEQARRYLCQQGIHGYGAAFIMTIFFMILELPYSMWFPLIVGPFNAWINLNEPLRRVYLSMRTHTAPSAHPPIYPAQTRRRRKGGGMYSNKAFHTSSCWKRRTPSKLTPCSTQAEENWAYTQWIKFLKNALNFDRRKASMKNSSNASLSKIHPEYTCQWIYLSEKSIHLATWGEKEFYETNEEICMLWKMMWCVIVAMDLFNLIHSIYVNEESWMYVCHC